mmetsp:Transcript_97575/g.164082  ORF Transcript_97575/g.164082 Transcript_97575/m.164082 type:complete len:257 (-) Transcript_97575:390-1160(-)
MIGVLGASTIRAHEKRKSSTAPFWCQIGSFVRAFCLTSGHRNGSWVARKDLKQAPLNLTDGSPSAVPQQRHSLVRCLNPETRHPNANGRGTVKMVQNRAQNICRHPSPLSVASHLMSKTEALWCSMKHSTRWKGSLCQDQVVIAIQRCHLSRPQPFGICKTFIKAAFGWISTMPFCNSGSQGSGNCPGSLSRRVSQTSFQILSLDIWLCLNCSPYPSVPAFQRQIHLLHEKIMKRAKREAQCQKLDRFGQAYSMST